MRLGRIVGVVLSILVLAYFVGQKLDLQNNNSNNNHPFELISDASGYLNENVATLNDQVFNETGSNVDIIEFTNTNNYPVIINQNDITINCTGTGINKDQEEAMVLNNYRVKARFSKEKNGNLESSLTVGRNEHAYIHIISEYEGELPQSEVSCQYSLSVSSS